MMKIAPSILATDLTDIKSTLSSMSPNDVDFIHIDVMDGHFVPTISFGEGYTALVAKHTSIPLDVHLMVERPELEIPKYFSIKPYVIIFHLEATRFPIRLANVIRENHIKAGIALNPGTSVELIEPLLNDIDWILLMSVEPGFYGQKFIPSVLNKVRRVSEMIRGRDILLQVDGGVCNENIAQLSERGAHVCVAGSAGFKGGDVNANCRKLKELAQKH